MTVVRSRARLRVIPPDQLALPMLAPIVAGATPQLMPRVQVPRPADETPPRHGAPRVVVCGSFRRNVPQLRQEFEALRGLGCDVLSPRNVDVVDEHDGFVFMEGELRETPETLERRHLDAIECADFVWLHAPEGYVGLSAALEVGFAFAAGVPVFTPKELTDQVASLFVRVVGSEAQAISTFRSNPTRCPRGLRSFQDYYRRAAVSRGYNDSDAKACLLLMLEEVGELARAIRKREGITRHHSAESTGAELADVLLYVVHMANILGIDLADTTGAKELVNHARFLRSLER